VVIIARKLEDCMGQVMSRPLVLRGIDGARYLCDSRYMGFSKREVVKILEWDERSGMMTVTDGRVIVSIDSRRPGHVYDCRKFVCKPESAIDRFMRMFSCDQELENGCLLARDCDLLEDLNKLPAEKFPFLDDMSFESRIVLLLAGLVPENELCSKCVQVVNVSKRPGIGDKDIQLGPIGSQMQRDALRGDLLQKYHFLTIAEFLTQPLAYVRIGELFSNGKQREYLELPGEEKVRKKYLLTSHNNDHTWGTAVEAEYQLDHGFRLRYMRHVCCVFCGWVVSDVLLSRVLFLEEN